MKFLVVSHRGAGVVPADQQEENGRQWGVWMGTLNEQLGLRAQGGRTVSSGGVGAYTGDSAGISIIEASSLEEAIERVEACPRLPYGWAFDVLTSKPSLGSIHQESRTTNDEHLVRWGPHKRVDRSMLTSPLWMPVN